MSGRRVLAVGPMPPPINGMSKAFEILVRRLPAHGWTAKVADLADRGTARTPGELGWRRAASVARVVMEASRGLRDADAFYLTISQSPAGIAKDVVLLALAHAAGVPAVVHLHGGNFRVFFEGLAPAARHAVVAALAPVRRFIVLTEELRPEFAMVRDADDRVIVVANPCDVAAGRARPAPRARLRILFLGLLTEEKGYRDLLRALELLPALMPGWQLEAHFAGAFALLGDTAFRTEAEMQSDFEARAAALAPTVRVVHHGVVDGAQKQRLFDEADVFVLPTYYVNEGQPIALLEALTSGLPVVATRHRGIASTLPPELRDLCVEPRSPAQIAERLAALVDDPEGYSACSEAACAAGRAFRPEAHVRAVAGALDAAAATVPARARRAAS